MNKYLHFILGCICTLALISCEESVLDKPDDSLNPDKVHLQLFASPEFGAAAITGKAAEANRRFIAEVYDAEELVERREVIYQPADLGTGSFARLPITFQLDKKSYKVLLWVDYIPKGSDEDFHYATKDLSDVRLLDVDGGTKVPSDAFAASASVDLSSAKQGEQTDLNLNLTPLMSSIKLTAVDWVNFYVAQDKDASKAQVRFDYNTQMPAGYNVKSNSLVLADALSVTLPLNTPDDPETATKTELSTFHFLTNPDGLDVSMEITILSEGGEELHKTQDVSFNVVPGGNEGIESSYLTGEEPMAGRPIFNGSGSAASPFLISTLDELTKLQGFINEGNPIYKGKSYKQTADLDLALSSLNIGTNDNPFTGSYDGAGFEIANASLLSSTEGYAGIFNVADGAAFKNLNVSGAVYAATDDEKANAKFGSFILGASRGKTTIENSHLSGTATGYSGKVTGGVCAVVESGSLVIRGFKADSPMAGDKYVAQYKTLLKTGGSTIGGFIGLIQEGAEAEVSDSYLAGLKVTNTSDKKAAQNTELDYIGGICGRSLGVLSVKRTYTNIQIFGSEKTAVCAGIIVTNSKTDGISDNYFAGFGVKEDSPFVGKSLWLDDSGANFSSEDGMNGYSNGALLFSETQWPDWDVANTLWSDLGSFASKVYPVLDWE